MKIGDKVFIRNDKGNFEYCNAVVVDREKYARTVGVEYDDQHGCRAYGTFGTYDLKKVKRK